MGVGSLSVLACSVSSPNTTLLVSKESSLLPLTEGGRLRAMLAAGRICSNSRQEHAENSSMQLVLCILEELSLVYILTMI